MSFNSARVRCTWSIASSSSAPSSVTSTGRPAPLDVVDGGRGVIRPGQVRRGPHGCGRGSLDTDRGNGRRTAGTAPPPRRRSGRAVARWYICSADNERSTPIHCTSSDASLPVASSASSAAARDAEHPGRHVGALDRLAEAAHAVRARRGSSSSRARRRAAGCRRSTRARNRRGCAGRRRRVAAAT